MSANRQRFILFDVRFQYFPVLVRIKMLNMRNEKRYETSHWALIIVFMSCEFFSFLISPSTPLWYTFHSIYYETCFFSIIYTNFVLKWKKNVVSSSRVFLVFSAIRLWFHDCVNELRVSSWLHCKRTEIARANRSLEILLIPLLFPTFPTERRARHHRENSGRGHEGKKKSENIEPWIIYDFLME